MIKKIRKHIRKHINRKKLEKIKKFTNPYVIKYTFYSIGAIISIAIQIINRTFKIKNFRRSKLTCGCGWTIRLYVGKKTHFFMVCGWTIN